MRRKRNLHLLEFCVLDEEPLDLVNANRSTQELVLIPDEVFAEPNFELSFKHLGVVNKGNHQNFNKRINGSIWTHSLGE